jgi:hypothetical protein
MRPSRLARAALHLANLAVILFFLLPLIAAVIAALQSEKSLQATPHAIFPQHWSLDNFRVILSGGQQHGTIFDQVTYLPDNVRRSTTRWPTAPSSRSRSRCSRWCSPLSRPSPWCGSGCAGCCG